MANNEVPKIYKIINSNNYLSNCYRILTRSKTIHFLCILIEMILNILQELEVFVKLFNNESNSSSLNNISYITNIFDKLNNYIKLIVMVLIVVLIDILYLIYTKNDYKTKNIGNIIIINILELFFFRTAVLIYFNFYFTIHREYFLFSCIFLFIHIYLILNNFFYNHLFYFVPEFINYPYDEFSSIFDLALFFSKIILAISSTTNNAAFGKFLLFLLIFFQIFFCFYFTYKLKNHSYLFMKNSFLNKTKTCFFYSQTFIILFALFIGINEIKSALFIIMCVSAIIIFMCIIYLIYDPFNYIKIKTETRMENLYFYLYILSEKNDYNFLFENKLNVHYKNCGFCDLCKKYNEHIGLYKKNIQDEERARLINDESNQNNDDSFDYFNIIYDGKMKYFDLVKKIILNNKHKDKESLYNNSYYYINLSFLVYSDYQENNITLSLNERILLEVLYKENSLIWDNYEVQINQILLCNKFISLGNEIVNLIKNILNLESNFNKALKFIELSLLLKEMKSKKYKKTLFSHKSENMSNSKHLLLTCSIVYEEIFNVTLNTSSHMPIRDNIQPLEEVFHNNINKNNKIISLALNLTNKDCRIIRAGKGLHSYIDSNLFDLFPLIFKKYQIDLFMSNILESFSKEKNKPKIEKLDRNITSNKKTNKNLNKIIKNRKSNSFKTINNNDKSKKELIETKIILCENFSSKMYYKLFTLKLSILFSSDNNYFILFDGLYYLHSQTIITLQDFENNSKPKEKLVGVSEPSLDNNFHSSSVNFKKLIVWQNGQGFNITKLSSFNIINKTYNIYQITKKEKNNNEKNFGKIMDSKKDLSMIENNEENSSQKNNDMGKINAFEDNSSVQSQTTESIHSAGFSSLGMRNKKRDNIFEHEGFNKTKKINLIVIFIAIIALFIEYFYLYKLKKDTYNNNNSYIHFREFSKLYFQLFTSFIGVSCIHFNNTCLILTDIYTEIFYEDKEVEFNYTILAMIQNDILCSLLLERKNYLADIHKCIGDKNYNDIFNQEIKYLRITQNYMNGKLNTYITYTNIQFSEAILIICNSFQALKDITSNPITFLEQTDNPFSNLEKENIESLNDVQKNFYEMIINYMNFYKAFDYANDKLHDNLFSKSNFIEIFIYFFLIFGTALLIVVGILMYVYILCFEKTFIKVINYVNMILNEKNDDFNFYLFFSQKIENLETILQFYNGDPLKAVINLNGIYTKYEQLMKTKNKNSNENSQKKYKNYFDKDKKNELDNVPKNQRIVNKGDVDRLGITFIYICFVYFYLLFCIVLFVILIILWLNYFSKKKNLYTLIEKNLTLETSLYRAINLYELMIFNNLTLSKVTQLVYGDREKDEKENIYLKSFYDDLKLSFDSKREKNKISTIYKDFEDYSNFTCEKFIEYNNENMIALSENPKSKNTGDIPSNLINLCIYSRVSESNDYRTIFERHFQYIRNGILSINDYSYLSLISHIKDGILPRLAVFFNVMIMHILEVTNTLPHRQSIENILTYLSSLILYSEIIFLCCDIVSIIFSLFFYKNINNKCSQILLLKQIFKIVEIQEL